jgi:hypothetical protein
MRASRGSRGATRALAPIGLLIALGWLSACSPTPVPAGYPRSDASTARSDGAAASAASANAAATPAGRESVRLAYTSIVGVAAVQQQLAASDPRVAAPTVDDLLDPTVVDRLAAGGFYMRLYGARQWEATEPAMHPAARPSRTLR